MFSFPSHARIAAKKVAKYFVIAALVFLGWDFYVWVRHGHIIGGIFMAGICVLVALALYSFKGQVVVTRASYKAAYKIAGIAFNFEYPFSTYKILQVEYDCLYSRPAQRHPEVLQLYLVPNAQTPKSYWVSLSADIYFDKEHPPEEVAAFVARFIGVSGVALSWGNGPFEPIKERYSECQLAMGQQV